ncbi:MAG: dihydroorotase [Gammaproteobacteria bacterium RIFCSPLOWO2_02_FULL_47_50]|jgi:dihydroorotase|nr:MAG: dihydroorotase [Gammaproteobacteria bacterium RIFCSPLOWO2_01_FULL_47_190]OGT75185.1 MAG: dihydroorotase [Gammaproteobacteria bacterium RIFCSPLOWO2_12_47_11]OGT79773.1 MAG: dihydroorotase [Gammaproteobacteria bacterium RIFCSPLOWO2_02_FULL_47_50]OGT85194.1 MAG: dihydroorotase [Gammaproteobacteria bacterium RIFCSPLOWO2_12_FULL_47_76]
MRTVIKHGRIVDPANKLDKVADLFIENGKIVAIGKDPAGYTPEQIVEAKNRIVCPGLVDLSARLREPGQEYKATIASETAAAASAGITSICCPPDTSPVIDTSAVAELIHQRALLANKAKVYCLGALTSNLKGKTLANMHTLKTAGCIGVSNAYAAIGDTAVLRRALEYAATCNLTVHLFCEDDGLRNNGVIHEGMMSVRLGLPGIPETAETIAVSRALLLIEQTETKVHFCRISSARSLELIAQAKQQGLSVTADVGISHLYLTEIDLAGFNSLCHVRPPLRTTRDRDELRKALVTGTLDVICSDHQPHDEDAKAAPFGLTEPGVSTLDVLLSLSLQLVQDKVLDLQTAIAALTINPAKIAGIDAGHLGKGTAADVCIIDPELSWVAEKETLASAGKNCPFLGWEMTGKVTHTLLDGNIVYGNTS